MSEIQTTFPTDLFPCKRCGQRKLKQWFKERTQTGVNITELQCLVCEEYYRIRWLSESPEKWILSHRKLLCIDDCGYCYMENVGLSEPAEAANLHLALGRGRTILKTERRRGERGP